MRRFSTKVEYDALLDPATWKGHKPGFLFANVSPAQREIRAAKAVATVAANNKKRGITAARENKKNSREMAELRAAELVRQVVGALEFSMAELMGHAAPSNYQRHVNQKQLHNAIVMLKTKCGVSFASTEFDPYSKKVTLDSSSYHRRENGEEPSP